MIFVHGFFGTPAPNHGLDGFLPCPETCGGLGGGTGLHSCCHAAEWGLTRRGFRAESWGDRSPGDADLVAGFGRRLIALRRRYPDGHCCISRPCHRGSLATTARFRGRDADIMHAPVSESREQTRRDAPGRARFSDDYMTFGEPAGTKGAYLHLTSMGHPAEAITLRGSSSRQLPGPDDDPAASRWKALCGPC